MKIDVRIDKNKSWHELILVYGDDIISLKINDYLDERDINKCVKRGIIEKYGSFDKTLITECYIAEGREL